MTNLRDEDRLLAARYVDGELEATDVTAFEERLATEPALVAYVTELRDTVAWFAPGRDEATPTPSEGFHQRVLREVRRLPRADELAGAQPATNVVGFEAACRRIMVAAALLIGVGLLVFGGLLHKADSGELDASPAEIRQKMDELDALIREREFGENR